MAFEEFIDEKPQPQVKLTATTIKITAKGLETLASLAPEFRTAGRVRLFYDRARDLIGIAPAKDGSFEMKRTETGATIGARKYFERYGISPAEPHADSFALVDGIAALKIGESQKPPAEPAKRTARMKGQPAAK